MSITGIQAVRNVYESLASANAARCMAETPQNSTSQQTDTAQISQEAKDLAKNNSDAAINGQAQLAEESSEEDLPLEAYSLPKWYAELSSDLLLLDSEVGIPYSQSRRAKYDALSSREKKDLAEYQDKLHSCFQEELHARGIDDSRDYYEQVVLDPANSEEIHQAVKEKLLDDARAVQLMEYFGIAA